MSYLAKDTSVDSSQPVLLFQFVQGSTTYRYTTQGAAITILGYTWDPVASIPGNFVSNNDYPKDTLMVRLPLSATLAQTFVGPVPDAITTITVFRAQVGETDYAVYWKGRVASTAITGEFMSIECEPVFSSLKRPALRQIYTRSCRHVHYGTGCNLVAGLWTVSGLTVTALTGAVLTIPAVAALSVATGHFNGGSLFMADGSSRTVIDHTGITITLIRPFPALAAALIANPSGVAVTMTPGCNHTVEQCNTKFNNKGNFGGPCVWAPRQNPYTTSVEA